MRKYEMCLVCHSEMKTTYLRKKSDKGKYRFVPVGYHCVVCDEKKEELKKAMVEVVKRKEITREEFRQLVMDGSKYLGLDFLQVISILKKMDVENIFNGKVNNYGKTNIKNRD